MVYNFTIDGVNIGERFGVFISRGGYNELLTFPSIKDPESNDWPEEDGIEVDLSDPKYGAVTAEISFVAGNKNVFVSDFIDFISTPGRRVLRVISLCREWVVRLLTNPQLTDYIGVTSFSLEFSIDDPVLPSLSDPVGGGINLPASAYELDGIPFDRFGIVIEKGRDDVIKMPAIKKTLSSSYRTSNGIEYDAELVKFSSKEVTLKGCFIASDIARFWACYDAFFAALIQPGLKSLYVDYMGDEYPCYYKKSDDFEIKDLSSYVIVNFSITLIFTVFRLGEMEYLLAAEDGCLIVCQDGETLIDMKCYAK
nr:hypothetical protein [Parabacteroides goldsteinii]